MPVYKKATDRPAIFYGYAMGKLVGGKAFASDWHCLGYSKDDVYFLDLGDPLNDNFIEHKETVVRYFKNGFVLITRTNTHVNFEPDLSKIPKGVTGLWDVYEGTRAWNWESKNRVSIQPAYYPATDSYCPSGRVYLYLTK